MRHWLVHNTASTDTFEGRPLGYYSGSGERWTTMDNAERYRRRRSANRAKARLEEIPGRDHWRLVVEKA